MVNENPRFITPYHSATHLAYILSFVLMSACGSSQKPEVTTASFAHTYPATVSLLSNGSAPRSLLRYQVTPDSITSIELQIAHGMFIRRSETTLGFDAVPVVLRVQAGPVKIVKRLPNGNVVYRVPLAIQEAKALLLPGVDPNVISTAEQEIAPLRKLAGTLEIDSQGATHQVNFALPKEIPVRTLNLLGNIRTSLVTVALPDEHIGVGGSWRVSRDIRVDTIVVKQTITYTLIGKHGSAIELQAVIRQSAPPQQLRSDMNTQASLETYETTGTGTVNLNLTDFAGQADAATSTQIHLTLVPTNKDPIVLENQLETVIRASSKQETMAKSTR